MNKVYIFLFIILLGCDPAKEYYETITYPISRINIDDDGEYHFSYTKGSYLCSEHDRSCVTVKFDNIDSPILKIKYRYLRGDSQVSNDRDGYTIVLPRNYQLQLIND